MSTFVHPPWNVHPGTGAAMTTVKQLKAWLGRKTWRTATAIRCPNCKTPIVAGLDADACAGRALADPTPLDATGEAHALLAGLATYTAHRTNNGAVQLTRRSGRWPTIIRSAHDVWPAHACRHMHTHTTGTLLDPHTVTIDPDAPAPF